MTYEQLHKIASAAEEKMRTVIEVNSGEIAYSARAYMRRVIADAIAEAQPLGELELGDRHEAAV